LIKIGFKCKYGNTCKVLYVLEYPDWKLVSRMNIEHDLEKLFLHFEGAHIIPRFR